MPFDTRLPHRDNVLKAIRLWVSGPGCPLIDASFPVPGGKLAPDPSAGRPHGPVEIRCDVPEGVLRVHVELSVGHALDGEALVVRKEGGRVVPRRVLEAYLDRLGLPRATDARGRFLLVLPAGVWEVFRFDGIKQPTSFRYPHGPGFLGSAVVGADRVTDLAVGADPR